MNRVRLIGPLLGCLAGAAPALAADEAMDLLLRSAVAARQLNYSGVFVYEAGGRMETSRINHMAADGHEHEKIERLDGPPQELIRHDDEITCVNPAEHVLHVQRGGGRRFFPALVPAGATQIGDTYEARLGRVERVAGFDCRVVQLKPRDGFRFGRRMCIEPTHGLLLRATLRGENDEILEQFAFTQLRMADRADASSVAPSVPIEGWPVQQPPRDPKPWGGWAVGNPPLGFRKVFQFHRDGSDHLVYSDGLAAVSVFIEPLGNSADPGPSSTAPPRTVGPSSVLQRRMSNSRVTVVGEVPPAALLRFSESVSRLP
jgi:sigma-E factor negative regulatory protein RseB